MQIAAPLVVDEEQPTRRPRARLRRRPVTDGTTDWGRISALALLCALLVVLTGATFLLMPRYDPLGEPLIADPAFDAGLVDWRQAGLISQDLDDPDEVVLESISSTARTYLARDLDLPPGDTLLILGTRVKGDEVVTGTEPWDGARMYLAQLDADGQPNWEDNHNVFNLNGTTDIRNYRRAFTIPAEIQTTRLGIELKNATGRLTVSQLELSVVAYKTSYKIAVGCLLLAWSALVLYIAIKTFGGIDSVRIRLCLGVLCALSVVALMLPGGVHDIGTQGIAAQFGISEIGVDSIGHGVMFTALAFLVRLGRPFDPLWLHVGAWLLIAVASEVLQLFTVGRDPSFDDLWLDGVGVLLGLALAEITLRMRRSSAA